MRWWILLRWGRSCRTNQNIGSNSYGQEDEKEISFALVDTDQYTGTIESLKKIGLEPKKIKWEFAEAILILSVSKM